ncbi:MAG: hypothetical protein J5746_04090 [Victivallales bacterium]|nr:hypothetical protein [Victivallales bacterium]
MQSGGDTVIHINPEAAERQMFKVFGDELVHYLEATSPDTYNLLKDILLGGERTEAMESALDYWRSLYPDLVGNDAEMDEEMASHILGRVLSDYQTQLDLANELEARKEGAGRSFLEAVLDTLSKVLRWLANWGDGRESRMLFHEYDDVRRKVVKTLADYAELKRQLGEATGETVTMGNGLEAEEMQNRIRDWLKPENLEMARGKTRAEIFEMFGNELQPIAFIPQIYLPYLNAGINDNRVYSGAGYFIEHAVNHHPEVDASSYDNIQAVIDNADDVKLDNKNKERNPSILFIKQINPTGVVVVSFDEGENGKIVLHKSFFEKTKKGRFDKLPSIKNGANASLMVGNPIISPNAEASAAVRRISALNDGDTIQRNAEGANANAENSTPAVLPSVTFGLREMGEGEKPKVNDSDPEWYRAAKERGLTFRAWHPGNGGEAPAGGIMAIVDLASGDVLFSGDEGYRGEFQPRYETATRDAQISGIAQNPHEEQFFTVDATDKGTPVFVYQDGVIYAVAGNGRGKAMRRMYRDYNTAGRYRELVAQWARQNGLPFDETMKEPALVRILPEGMGDREIRQFADFANKNSILQASRSESLLTTAAEITGDAEMLALLHPAKEGDLLTQENMEFFLRFLERYGTIEGDLDERGLPTEAVETRVIKALLASLFLDETDKMQSLRTVNELMSRRAADLGISTRVNAVAANMPLVFEMHRLHPEYDLSQELGLAMRALLDYAAHRKSFTSPGMFARQLDIDGNLMSENVQALFLPLAEAKTTADVNAVFQGWSDSVDAELNGMSALMGERRTKEQMLQDRLAAYKEAHPDQFRYSVAEQHSLSALEDIANGKAFGLLQNAKFGEIQFPLGKLGVENKNGKRKGGFGFLHIIQERILKDHATLDEALGIAIKVGIAAEIGKNVKDDLNTHWLDYDGVRAIIAETEQGIPILTGYEIRKENAGENEAAFLSSSSLQNQPLIREADIVAALKDKLQRLRENASRRYSISELWTGSAADYEKPSLHYIGTGEGAQVYGWGLYATDNRGIAVPQAGSNIRYSVADPDSRYTLENAVPSKQGYRVEKVNETCGADLNNAKGVVCEQINQVFNPSDAPEKGFAAWITQKVVDYMEHSGMLNNGVYVHALESDVIISKATALSLGNHGGPDAKYNIIPVIPEMLRNGVLIQTEAHIDPANGKVNSYSHLLASKVRYDNERYIAVMVIHDNNGVKYYDHSIMLIKRRAS